MLRIYSKCFVRKSDSVQWRRNLRDTNKLVAFFFSPNVICGIWKIVDINWVTEFKIIPHQSNCWIIWTRTHHLLAELHKPINFLCTKFSLFRLLWFTHTNSYCALFLYCSVFKYMHSLQESTRPSQFGSEMVWRYSAKHSEAYSGICPGGAYIFFFPG